MNNFKLDTFERVKPGYTYNAPQLMKALKAKRNLMLIKWGWKAAVAAVLVTLYLIIPFEASVIIGMVLGFIGLCWGLIWFIISGSGKLTRWYRDQKYIVERANNYGVIDD
jgi:hypothetical protein